MKPLPVPPAARGGDARAQIAARAAFRHIFTRRGAHSTRFSRSLSLSIFPSFLFHALSPSLFSHPSLSLSVSLSLSPSLSISHAPVHRRSFAVWPSAGALVVPRKPIVSGRRSSVVTITTIERRQTCNGFG